MKIILNYQLIDLESDTLSLVFDSLDDLEFLVDNLVQMYASASTGEEISPPYVSTIVNNKEIPEEYFTEIISIAVKDHKINN